MTQLRTSFKMKRERDLGNESVSKVYHHLFVKTKKYHTLSMCREAQFVIVSFSFPSSEIHNKVFCCNAQRYFLWDY